MISIERPEFALLAILFGFIGLFLGFKSFSMKQDILKRFGEINLIQSFSDLKITRQRLKIVFYAFSIMSLTFAASGPMVSAHNLLKRDAIDVVAVVDVSKSMSARDFGLQTRLAKAKQILGNLFMQLNKNKIGIVTFAGTAMEQAPLTQDYTALRFILDEWIQINSVHIAGSHIVNGMKIGTDMLKGSDKGKLMILLTDGGGELEGITEVSQAIINENIKLIIVGLGSKKGYRFEPKPFSSHYQSNKDRKYFFSALEEEKLQNIAARSGGKYINGNSDALDFVSQIFKKDVLEESLFEGQTNVYFIPLVTAICLLALTFLL